MANITRSPWLLHYDGSSCNGCDIEVLAALTPVYDAERTICDLIRSRSSIETQTFQDALKQYARSREKDLRKLMRNAKMFHVEKILRQYLEVLL